MPSISSIGIRLGLGTFPFSGVLSEVDQDRAEQIVRRFVDGGGRYIETAPIYPVNNVDLASIIANIGRDKIFVATKCVTGLSSGSKIRSGKADWIARQVDQELERLRISRLDLIQAHIVPEDTPLEELVLTLANIRASGLAANIGLSNITREDLELALEIAPIDFVQNRFSFLHRRDHEGLNEVALRGNVLLNPYQTIERGQLATATRGETTRTSTDIRNTKHEYSGEAFSTVRSWVEELLVPIARREGLELESLMVAWTLAQNTNSVPIVGFTDPKQVSPILRGLTCPISRALHDELESAYSEMNLRTQSWYGLSLDEYRGIS